MPFLDLDLPRILGALSGLATSVAISPIRPTLRIVFMVKLSVYLAFTLAPFTFYLMSSSEKFILHAVGVFIASLFNSLVFIPLTLHLTCSRKSNVD